MECLGRIGGNEPVIPRVIHRFNREGGMGVSTEMGCIILECTPLNNTTIYHLSGG